ncbi:acyl-CoA dehydrogenase family protein [Nocardiopsis oceani]
MVQQPADSLVTPTTLSGDERAEFRSSVRAFLEAHAGADDAGTGFDPGVWRKLAGGLGVGGLLVPDHHGGLGLTHVESAVVLEEAARALYDGPVLSAAVLVPTALLASGDRDACERHLPAVARGDGGLALAIDDVPEAKRAGAVHGPRGWEITGVKTAVINAQSADTLLVTAEDSPGGIGLFEVGADGPGVETVALDVLDRTRRQARVTFRAVPAQRLGGDFRDGAERLLDVGAVSAAAEALGACERAFELAVDHARNREQFGRPIGSFQAVKHLCAEMLVQVESQRAAVRAASLALNTSREEAHEAASVAKAYSSTAATAVVETAIQVLGGIGFTWEHPAHLYLRRVKTLQFQFGDARRHRQRLAALLRAGS